MFAVAVDSCFQSRMQLEIVCVAISLFSAGGHL